MKKIMLVLLGGILLTLIYCDKNETTAAPVCGEGCLFTQQEAAGTMVRMACFDRFAIKTVHPETDSIIYGIPDQLDLKFQEEGKSVVFSGSFRENTLTPSFPDPSVSMESIFQMNLTEIR
jgi:hypothetical protein